MFVEIKKLQALSCDCIKKINVGVYIDADAVSMNKIVFFFQKLILPKTIQTTHQINN